MSQEQDRHINLSPSVEKDWANEVEMRLPGYLIANQGEVHDDEITYTVYQGIDRQAVEVTLSKAHVAAMMSRQFGLVPITPQKYVEWDHTTVTRHTTVRSSSASDLKRSFQESLKLGLALGKDDIEAGQIGWALAHRMSSRGRVVGDQEHVTLKTERRKKSQACVLFVVDTSISITQRHTKDSLQKYIALWVGAAHDDMVERTIYYGKQNTTQTSSLDRAINELTYPNSAIGYEQAHLLVDRAFPRNEWNRFMIHITSATDDPGDPELYDQVTTDATKQMDYVGIVPVGHYSTYSVPFRRAIDQNRRKPSNFPRLAQVPDSRDIPKAMWQLFGSWEQISAQNEGIMVQY